MIVHIKDKHYKEKQIFSNRIFDFASDGVSIVKAPSGYGKTTLLRIISSLDRDYEGFIEDPPCFPVVVFQEDRLVENLSVEANLRAVSKDRNLIRHLLSEVGLIDEIDNKVNELSGGMKRRVSIIRALLLDYDWLLLDEPFQGLDDVLCKKLSSLILSFSKGKGLIVITHDDRDVRLFGGKVIELERE